MLSRHLKVGNHSSCLHPNLVREFHNVPMWSLIFRFPNAGYTTGDSGIEQCCRDCYSFQYPVFFLFFKSSCLYCGRQQCARVQRKRKKYYNSQTPLYLRASKDLAETSERLLEKCYKGSWLSGQPLPLLLFSLPLSDMWAWWPGLQELLCDYEVDLKDGKPGRRVGEKDRNSWATDDLTTHLSFLLHERKMNLYLKLLVLPVSINGSWNWSQIIQNY